MGVASIRSFGFIEPPPDAALNDAIRSLIDHGAIDSNENLTPLGEMLAQLPVEVTVGTSRHTGCTHEAFFYVFFSCFCGFKAFVSSQCHLHFIFATSTPFFVGFVHSPALSSRKSGTGMKELEARYRWC